MENYLAYKALPMAARIKWMRNALNRVPGRNKKQVIKILKTDSFLSRLDVYFSFSDSPEGIHYWMKHVYKMS